MACEYSVNLAESKGSRQRLSNIEIDCVCPMLKIQKKSTLLGISTSEDSGRTEYPTIYPTISELENPKGKKQASLFFITQANVYQFHYLEAQA